MPAKTPQDRLPKAADKVYSFTATVTDDDGKSHKKTFRLPSAADAAQKVPGRFLRDAAMSDDGELALGFATLEAAGVDQSILDALYSLPAPEMMKHIYGWLNFKAAAEDASVGESSGSSA